MSQPSSNTGLQKWIVPAAIVAVAALLVMVNLLRDDGKPEEVPGGPNRASNTSGDPANSDGAASNGQPNPPVIVETDWTVELHRFILAGDVDQVRRVLEHNPAVEAPFTVERADVAGLTPLLASCRLFGYDMTAALLDAGANADAISPDGWSAAHYAAQNRDGGALRALLNVGANINDRNPSMETPLIVAVRANRAQQVLELLEALADPDAADSSGRTALMHASILEEVDLAMLLLNAGASIEMTDDSGLTALEHAKSVGTTNIALVEMLQDAGR